MRRVLVLLVLALVAAAALARGSAGAPSVLLPDLVADPPDSPSLESYQLGGDTRLLLRFNGYIHNRGFGAAEIRGSSPSAYAGQMRTVVQTYPASGAGSATASSAQVIYESADGHDHWHLKHAARYSLWNDSRTAEVAPAMKVGFCLEDGEPVDSQAGRRAVYTNGAVGFCESGHPEAQNVFMGVSAGWRDIYDRGLAFQWVDVSDVQPGTYRLRAEVDPDNVLRESDEANAAAYAASASVIPGYLARPVLQAIAPGAPADVALAADRYGSAGSRQFRIERAPARGTLDVPVGQWLDVASVRYTPAPGATGTDSFEYSARDATSSFPRTAARATAGLAIGSSAPATVAISGAPATITAGTSVQLGAAVTNGAGPLTWSVDGVRGGDGTVGTISPAGLYRAPSAVPPGGAVTIRAAAGSAWDEVRLGVVAPKPPDPAIKPSARPPARPPARPGRHPSPLPAPGIVLQGRSVFVYSRPTRAGRVSVVALRGRRRVASCRTVRVPTRRRHTCRLKISKKVPLRQVTVVVRLQVGRKVVATRRSRIPLRRVAHRHGH